jgi:MYXO-CTERM domain-containing protein
MPILLAVTSCFPTLDTQNGELRIVAQDVSTLGVGAVPAPMLLGTKTCPAYECLGVDCPPTHEEALACFDRVPGGGVTFEPYGGCWEFDALGPATWSFVRTDCAAGAAGYRPSDDLVTFEVVGPAEVMVTPYLLERAGFLPAEGEAFPADWLPATGEPWRLVVGQPFLFRPDLVLAGAPATRVGYSLGAVSATAAEADRPPVVTANDGLVEVTYVDPGDPADILVQLAGVEQTLVSVEPVDGAEAASLEVVPTFLEQFDGSLTPTGARAVVRDATGELMFGAPVEWSLDEGLLAVGRGPEVGLPGADYVVLLDACVPPEQNAGDHCAIVRASLGGLTATGELRWTAPPRPEEPDWAASESCEQGQGAPPPPPDTGSPPDPGATPPIDPEPRAEDDLTALGLTGGHCGCGSGPGGAGAAGWAVVLGLFAVRRKSSR